MKFFLLLLAQLCNAWIMFVCFHLNSCFRMIYCTLAVWRTENQFHELFICSHKHVDPNADSQAVAIFFRPFNFAIDSQHSDMTVSCFF